MEITQLLPQGISRVLENLILCTQRAVENGGGFGWIAVPSENELFSYWSDVVSSPRIIALIAVDKDRVVGSVQLTLPERRSEAAKFVGNLSVFFVDPEFRRQGVGTALLEVAEQTARSRGLTQLNLDVRATQREAIALYTRWNFKTWGTNPRYARINEVYVAGHHMSKYYDE